MLGNEVPEDDLIVVTAEAMITPSLTISAMPVVLTEIGKPPPKDIAEKLAQCTPNCNAITVGHVLSLKTEERGC